MKKRATTYKILFLLIIVLNILCLPRLKADEPESGYIFAYSTDKHHNSAGLHFTWSTDRENWHAIGPEHSYVRSDYGRWGSQKKMFTPFLFRASDGVWHCIWTLNDTDGVVAHASSPDLIYWGRQSYPLVMPEGNCMMPEIKPENNRYTVTWINKKSGSDELYSAVTGDFKEYTPAKKINTRENLSETIIIDGEPQTGTVHKVSWKEIDNLINAQRLAAYKGQQWGERVALDDGRFKEPVTASIKMDVRQTKKISDLLLGIFFEDINYAADGGLYAELIQNRGFEYDPSDKEGHDKNWNSRKSWSVSDANAAIEIETANPIHRNNPHYAVLTVNRMGSGIINEGFDGIPIKAGEKYDFSVFARTPESKKGKLTVRLIGKNGEIYGETTTKPLSKDWKKYEAAIIAKQTVNDARLEIVPQYIGRTDIDMVSLFPQNTFKGRKNGLRADLAQTIADMKPRFVRFPGGCVAHGDGLGNIYRWENTIGSLESRKPQRNLWGYQQSAGLGYFEYFQFCEDLGAEPLPVVAAGVPCQNSAHHGCPIGGQQGGIPMSDMEEYIQSILNLIEYANGDTKSEWGRKRAEAGHPAPFNLKYLGVGNEDLITDIFEERFTMIFNAVKEKYPDVTVIGTSGPFCEGTDYVEGWNIATQLGVPMIDEHYYQSPGWYLNNQDYYDRYDRTKAQVYLGEYAAHIPGRHNNIETALCEALHLTNIERNGDIVAMTSYAPLLAKEGYTQWNPDLIYFNNTEVKPTVGYQVQKLFGQNSGDEYIQSVVTLSNNHEDVKKRISTSFVRDSRTGDLIVKLINMLPVEVDTKVDISDVPLSGTDAQYTVLSGNLDDKQARPIQKNMQVSSVFDYKMPAHSLSVIRIKTNNN